MTTRSALAILWLQAACVVPSLDARAKHCTPTDSCPSGLACLAAEPGVFRCLAALEFQQGRLPAESYAGATSTTLNESQPTATAGSESVLWAHGDFPLGTFQHRVALLRWELPNSLVAGAVVASARLEVDVAQDSHGAPYSIFVLKRDFAASQATWAQAASGQAWSVPGASGTDDRGPSLAQWAPSQPGAQVVELNSAAVASLQSRLDDGLSWFAVEIAGDWVDALALNSVAHAEAAKRPKLVLNVIPPAPK